MKSMPIGLILIGALVLFFLSRWLWRESFEILSETCAKKTSCGDCLKQVGCGWCGDAQKCVARAGLVPNLPRDDVTGIPYIADSDGKKIATCDTKKFIAMPTKCPEFDCTTLKGCDDCASVEQCIWCSDLKKCFKKKEDGSPDSGKETCAADKLIGDNAKCPLVKCEDLTDCQECAKKSGCGFCMSSNKCVTLNKFGSAADKSCEAGDIAATLTKCPDYTGPPDSSSGSLASVSGRDADVAMPTEADMAAIQTNEMAPGQIPGLDLDGGKKVGSGAVSPATPYQTATAPGVVRPLEGGTRDNFPVSRPAPNTEPGPFEIYIQSIVRSELAAQGVPTNEPFQVQTIVNNAGGWFTGVMKKVFG